MPKGVASPLTERLQLIENQFHSKQNQSRSSALPASIRETRSLDARSIGGLRLGGFAFCAPRFIDAARVIFRQAIARRSKPVASIEQGRISTASYVLANFSLKLGGCVLVYDLPNAWWPGRRKPRG